jgi:hypothetical protein
MVRRAILYCCVLLGCLAQQGLASSFGFSVNINFGVGQQPVGGGAGIFGDRIWNNFDQAVQDQPTTVLTDLLGNLSRSPASITWNSPGIQFTDRVKSDNPEDMRLMRGFLESPSTIVLNNVDQIVPPQDGPITYSVILYTFGAQEGAEGTYKVNGRSQAHIDTGAFDGRFIEGVRGNILIFKDLIDPSITIETDGFGPLNAISLVYCRPGDFDGDGDVDVTDLEALNEAVKSGSSQFDFDVNFDLSVDFNDVLSWIKCSKGTCIGDVNLDGVFNSSDLIQLFAQGVYESGESATWTSGDWNGDFKFDSSDLLVAFQEGCYQAGDALAVGQSCTRTITACPSGVAVPEPSGAWLWGVGGLLCVRARKACCFLRQRC